ncbi:hypothetical protein ZWY2020_055444 [Hordeum vulgare]|nr:hypothetical protein ZWY2020_055444 [Hordeum vulgare]
MVLPRLSAGPTLLEPEPAVKKLVICSPDLVAAVVREEGLHKLALCRPGAASWVVTAHDQLRRVQDMIFYQGKLYVLQETGGRLLSVSVGEDSDTGEPAVTRVDRLMRVPVWGYIEPPPQYLLESDGALLMIRRKDPNVAEPLQFPGNGGLGLNRVGAGLEKATGFKVFAADLAGSRWTKVRSVGEDRVLSVGQ